ncbi:hypothetical protein Tco_0543201 [Tanacetum coccineum]
MSKVLQERGFGSLPSSTEANPGDQVKSISTTIEADSYLICHIYWTELYTDVRDKTNDNSISKSRNQGDDLMSTIEEGEVIEEFRTRDDELDIGIDDYPRLEFTHANFFPLLYVNVMSKKFHNSIMKDKMVYKGNNVVGALMNIPIFVGTFSVMTDFAVLENMDAYRDEGMGDDALPSTNGDAEVNLSNGAIAYEQATNEESFFAKEQTRLTHIQMVVSRELPVSLDEIDGHLINEIISSHVVDRVVGSLKWEFPLVNRQPGVDELNDSPPEASWLIVGFGYVWYEKLFIYVLGETRVRILTVHSYLVLLATKVSTTSYDRYRTKGSFESRIEQDASFKGKLTD